MLWSWSVRFPKMIFFNLCFSIWNSMRRDVKNSLKLIKMVIIFQTNFICSQTKNYGDRQNVDSFVGDREAAAVAGARDWETNTLRLHRVCGPLHFRVDWSCVLWEMGCCWCATRSVKFVFYCTYLFPYTIWHKRKVQCQKSSECLIIINEWILTNLKCTFFLWCTIKF